MTENVTPLHPTDGTPDTIKPGPFTFEATCPECAQLVRFPIELFTRLTVDQNAGKLRVIMSSKALEHTCNEATDSEPMF